MSTANTYTMPMLLLSNCSLFSLYPTLSPSSEHIQDARVHYVGPAECDGSRPRIRGRSLHNRSLQPLGPSRSLSRSQHGLEEAATVADLGLKNNFCEKKNTKQNKRQTTQQTIKTKPRCFKVKFTELNKNTRQQ